MSVTESGPQVALVLAQQALLQAIAVDLAGERALEFAHVLRQVLRMGEIAKGQFAQLSEAVAQQLQAR